MDMDNKGLEQRVTELEEEVKRLSKIIDFGRIDCGYFDNE